MGVTIDNVIAIDLEELVDDVSRHTQMRFRSKGQEFERVVFQKENTEDVNQVFRYLLTSANEIADHSRATLLTGVSGMQALRQAYLKENQANIELFNFPNNEAKVKKDIAYQYCYDALKNMILFHWYRDNDDLEASAMCRNEGEKAMGKINNNSTTTKLFKAKYVPAW